MENKDSKSNNYMAVIVDLSIRKIVDKVNELDIKKEDIVSFMKSDGQFV